MNPREKHVSCRTTLSLALVVLVCLGGCGPVRETGAFRKGSLNDSVRYLAGMSVDRKSVFWEESRTPAYKKHMEEMDRFWVQVKGGTIDRMAPWTRTRVPGGRAGIAFYPMSGADFINFFLVYPDEKNYLMIAMEIPGEIPNLLALPEPRREAGLRSIERGLRLYGRQNYFQSREMKREMYNQSIPGAVPVILIFMARMGCKIHDISNVAMDGTGALVARERFAGFPPVCAGVRIRFSAPGSVGSRELTYLSMKFTDASLREGAPTAKFFGRLGPMKTMLKSAIYLLHMKEYREVKAYLLRNSLVVVQDDSGIPYEDFSGSWNVSLYGNYRYFQVHGTVYSFQKKLRDDYLARGKGPLPFNFGYGILKGSANCNMLIAKKKKA